MPGRELRAALEEFGDLLATSNSKEADFQRLFAERPYILSRTLPMRLAPGDIHPLGRPGKSEPDFAIFPAGDLTAGYGLIELKRPDSQIVTEPRKGVVVLSRDASTAVEQGLVYGEQMMNPLLGLDDKVVMLGNQRHIFIIMGLQSELVEGVSHEIYQRQLARQLPGGCRLIPYDTLLNAFKATVPPQIMVLVPSVEDSGLPAMVRLLEGSVWDWRRFHHNQKARDFWAVSYERVQAIARKGAAHEYPTLPPPRSYGVVRGDFDTSEQFARAIVSFLEVLAADADGYGLNHGLWRFLQAVDPLEWRLAERVRRSLSGRAIVSLDRAVQRCEESRSSHTTLAVDAEAILELETHMLVRRDGKLGGRNVHAVHPLARYVFRESIERFVG